MVRDHELKSMPSGDSVLNFSVATSRTWKDKGGEKQEQTEFHNMVAFGRQAEIIAEYTGKGSLLLVQGRLQTRSWEADGVKKYKTDIMVENVQLPPKSMSGGSGGNSGGSSYQRERTKADDDFDNLTSKDDENAPPARKPVARTPSYGGKNKPTATKRVQGRSEVEYPDDDINPDDIPF